MATIMDQNRTNLVGKQVDRRYTVDPVDEDTTYVSDGPLTIGIEYRILNEDVLNASYTPEEMVFVNAHRPEKGFDEEGFSLHVVNGRTGAERIRFDCFDSDPHYHYLPEGEWQYVIAYDREAGDDFLAWALARLRTRLPRLLRFVGEDELAADVENIDLNSLIDRVVAAGEALKAKAQISA